MKRLLISLLLAAAGAAHAALPRVAVDAPLAPLSAPGAAAAPSLTSPVPLSMATTLPLAGFVLPISPALPMLPAAAPALPELPIPEHGSALPEAAKRAERPLHLIDMLSVNGSKSASLTGGDLETAAPALERNFAAAAGLGRDRSGDGAVSPSAGASSENGPHDDLLARLRKRVALDDNSSPEQRAGL
ncbi:MAG: hypothetical protein KGL74_13060, partial [Elusimicrobia bacterium]|nr:hypothetical protein [Elusimicrobiota bacterium]